MPTVETDLTVVGTLDRAIGTIARHAMNERLLAKISRRPGG
jgi:hypothetical protein